MNNGQHSQSDCELLICMLMCFLGIQYAKLYKKKQKQVHLRWVFFELFRYSIVITAKSGISLQCQPNQYRKWNETLWNVFYSDFCYDIQRCITIRDHILHGSTFVLVSCREVTGVGAEPQSSVSDTGTADAAYRPALPWPDLPWHMTPLTPAGWGENSSPLTHITKIISLLSVQ